MTFHDNYFYELPEDLQAMIWKRAQEALKMEIESLKEELARYRERFRDDDLPPAHPAATC